MFSFLVMWSKMGGSNLINFYKVACLSGNNISNVFSMVL